MTDPNLEWLITELRRRASEAKKEYGVDTTREDYSLVDWLKEIRMEAVDTVVYCNAAIAKLEGPV